MLISPGMKNVHLAKEIKQEFKVKLYIHFGSCMKVLYSLHLQVETSHNMIVHYKMSEISCIMS